MAEHPPNESVTLGAAPLTIAQVAAVARGASVRLSSVARARMVEGVAAWKAHGDPHILRSKWEQLMGGPAPDGRREAVERFLLDHCAAVGEPLPRATAVSYTHLTLPTNREV